MAPQLAYIGMGNIGRGMSKNLVEKGNLSNPLILYNRTTKRAEEHSTKIGNSTVSTSISDLVSKADIIFICLGDDPAVFSTIDEITKCDIKSKIIVECSTIHPDSTTKEQKQIESAGGSFVACPVFGAPAMADAGQLVCVLAGPSDVVSKIKPYTKGVVARENIELLDQPPSQATLLKLLGNTFIASMVSNLSEGMVLAEKSGLGTENLHKMIAAMLPGPYTAYSDRMTSGDYYKRQDPLFAVDLAIKDVGHAQKIARDNGMEMNNLTYAMKLLKEVKEQRGQSGDFAAMYGAKRVESGLEFENQKK